MPVANKIGGGFYCFFGKWGIVCLGRCVNMVFMFSIICYHGVFEGGFVGDFMIQSKARFQNMNKFGLTMNGLFP